MEHDTSKDFACDIKKGDAMAVTTVLFVTFPLVDSDDGGIFQESGILHCFQNRVKNLMSLWTSCGPHI